MLNALAYLLSAAWDAFCIVALAVSVSALYVALVIAALWAVRLLGWA